MSFRLKLIWDRPYHFKFYVFVNYSKFIYQTFIQESVVLINFVFSAKRYCINKICNESTLRQSKVAAVSVINLKSINGRNSYVSVIRHTQWSPEFLLQTQITNFLANGNLSSIEKSTIKLLPLSVHVVNLTEVNFDFNPYPANVENMASS